MGDNFVIDRYEVRGVLGSGANGRVYLAYDPKLDREVAIKVVHPDLVSDEEIMRRFHREARSVAKLHHPNVLEIYDYSGPDSALAYLVVERLLGQNLEQLVEERGPLDAATAAACGHEICLALAHAHAQGIVHRDLKPENIFMEPSGRIVLCDFGIARRLKKENTYAGRETDVAGTPLFMSPEQITDPASVGPQSDLFSLGTTLYYLVSGQYAFGHDTIVKILKSIVLVDYPSLPDLAPELTAVIAQAFQADLGERFASAKEMGQALLRAMQAGGVADPRSALSSSALEVASSKTRTKVEPVRVDDIARRTLGAASTHWKTPVKGIEREALTQVVGPRVSVQGQTVVAAPAAKATSGVKKAVPHASVRSEKSSRAWPVLAVIGLALAASAAWFGRRALLSEEVVLAQSAHVLELPPAAVAPPAALPTPAALPGPSAPPTPQAVTSIPAPPPAEKTPDHSAAKIPLQKHAHHEEAPSASAAPATLRVIAIPWADVYVDGQKVGTTPIFRTMQLPSGAHHLRFVNPDFRNTDRDVTLSGGDIKEVRVTLGN